MLASKRKAKICANCKHAGPQFKLGKLTHLHCEHPDPQVNPPLLDSGLQPWDTLREFSNNCNFFKYK